MIKEVRIIELNENKYAVLLIPFKDIYKLVVIDAEDLSIIKTINSWNYSSDGNYIRHTVYIYFNEPQIIYDKSVTSLRREIYMHNLVMGNLNFNGKGTIETVDHINRVGTDNRKCNLRLVNQTQQNLNQHKKTRNIILPDDCEFTTDDIPTNVYFEKDRQRFVFTLHNPVYEYKTTGSKDYTLKDKLEMVKTHISELKKHNPELFKNTCMNGQYDENAVQLINEYNQIIKMSKFECYKDCLIKLQTKDYLHVNTTTLTEEGQQLCESAVVNFGKKTGRKPSTLPKDCGVDWASIPKYCYYTRATSGRSDKFTIDGHPNLFNKIGKNSWSTTGKSTVSTLDKFNELITMYNTLDD